jgi:transcriptional regulator with XRE-family HTH domain
MSKQFSHDLRLARRKAGLTQSDLAHLLGTSTKEVSALEMGRKLPSMPQLCELSLIYGRSFEPLFSELMSRGKIKIGQQLPSLPQSVRLHAGTFNRASSLIRLERRINQSDEDHE